MYLYRPLKVLFQGRAYKWKNQTNEEENGLMEIYERESISCVDLNSGLD